MKSTGIQWGISLVVGLAVVQGFAQEAGGVTKAGPTASKAESALAGGNWKTTLGGNVSSTSYEDSDTTSDMATLSGSIGYFFAEGLEMGLSLQMSATTQDETDISTTQFDGYFKYYLVSEADLVPYFGDNMGVLAVSVPDGSGESETTGTASLGMNVGCEFMMTENASFFVDLGVKADSENTSTMTVSYGFSFYF